MRCYVFGLVELADFIFEKEDEHGQKHEGQLTFADFMSVVLDLRKALQKLNVPLTKPCCRLHSGMEELRKTLRELSCHACVAWLCQRSCSALYLLCFLWITSKQVEHFQLFHFGQRWHRHAASVRGSPSLHRQQHYVNDAWSSQCAWLLTGLCFRYDHDGSFSSKCHQPVLRLSLTWSAPICSHVC